MHRKALRSAARVIVLGEDMRDRILAKGVDPARIAIVRDGAPLPEMLPPPDNPVARQIRGDFRFVLVHAGNLGFYGAWRTLIRAARLLAPEGVGLVFIGEGAKKSEIESEAAGCSNVRFLPYFRAHDVANVGQVVAIAPGEGPDRGQWVVVTEEQTTGTGPYDAVRRVLRDPALLPEMSARAREIALTYDKVKQIDAFVKIVEESSSE